MSTEAQTNRALAPAPQRSALLAWGHAMPWAFVVVMFAATLAGATAGVALIATGNAAGGGHSGATLANAPWLVWMVWLALVIVMGVGEDAHRPEDCAWCMARRPSQGRYYHAIMRRRRRVERLGLWVLSLGVLLTSWALAWNGALSAALFLLAAVAGWVGAFEVGVIRHRNRSACSRCLEDGE